MTKHLGHNESDSRFNSSIDVPIRIFNLCKITKIYASSRNLKILQNLT